jgi:hypothetical protein
VAGDPQREGLTGARPTLHHAHPIAALADVADHPRLVVADGRVGGQRRAHHLGRDHPGPLGLAVLGGDEQGALDAE